MKNLPFASPTDIALRWRIGLFLLVALLYAVGYVALYDQLGRSGSSLVLLPTVVGAWFFGWWGGLLSAVLGAILNIFLFAALGEDGLSLVLQSGLGGTIALLLVGTGFGGLSTLVSFIRRQSVELETANAQLRRYTAELEASNADLDAFAHTVAHDLKAPLTGIIGFAEMLDEDLSDLSPAERDHYLRRIVTNGRAMNEIINELLLLATIRRQEDIPVGVVEMSTAVENALSRLDHAVEKHQAAITWSGDWPPALGYRPWVEEVWVNYISNAVKYGGTPPRIELGASEAVDESGRVEFWVRDNGEGLSPAEQERLFRPFARVGEQTAEGHGLGLSIVRRIVLRLNGDVGIESTPGKGSRFYFRLPGA